MQRRSLTDLGAEQLAAARTNPNGRSAQTVYGGQGHALRQTLMALTAGSALGEHDSPGEATLLVLSGRVRLSAGDEGQDGTTGDHLVIPPSRHSLEALDDAVVLLTVAVG